MLHRCVRAIPSRPLLPRSVKLARPNGPANLAFARFAGPSRSIVPPRRPYSNLSMTDCWVGGHAIVACIVTVGGYIGIKSENNDLGPIEILFGVPFVAMFGSLVGSFIAITSLLTYPIGACVLLWNRFKKKNDIIIKKKYNYTL